MNRSATKGFTLIEVLVSLAVFALAAVVLSAAYLNVLSSYQAAARRQQSDEDWRWVRAAVLTEPERVKLEQGGQVALPGGRNVPWTVEIEPTEIADLFTVVLRASFEQPPQGEAAEREEKFMVLRPGWSDPAERDKLRAATKARLEEGRSP